MEEMWEGWKAVVQRLRRGSIADGAAGAQEGEMKGEGEVGAGVEAGIEIEIGSETGGTTDIVTTGGVKMRMAEATDGTDPGLETDTDAGDLLEGMFYAHDTTLLGASILPGRHIQRPNHQYALWIPQAPFGYLD